MANGPMILAVTHKIENSDLNSSTCEVHLLKVSHQIIPQGYLLEFGSDLRPLGCICGPGCVHKNQKIKSRTANEFPAKGH